eukprot:9244701-Alexandrium_andersonii.AAC.1
MPTGARQGRTGPPWPGPAHRRSAGGSLGGMRGGPPLPACRLGYPFSHAFGPGPRCHGHRVVSPGRSAADRLRLS